MSKKIIKKVSIFNNFSPNYKQNRANLNAMLKENNFIPLPKGDLIMVIGGDGTFLSAVHDKWMDGTPFAPVNDGNLGFFCEYRFGEVEKFIKDIANNNYYYEELPLYDVEIHHSDGHITRDIFLNDLTVKQQGSKVIQLDFILNKKHRFPYSCDGVVISSFIGSTGYNKSLNSSVMIDKINSFQITPIAPLSNKKYDGIAQPIIISDNNYLEIIPSQIARKQKQTLVVCDNKEYQLKKGIKKIVVKNTNKSIHILRTNNFSYQENIIDKVF